MNPPFTQTVQTGKVINFRGPDFRSRDICCQLPTGSPETTRPPPVPTERGVRISRTTLFDIWFTALQTLTSPGMGCAASVVATVSVV